FAVDLDFGARPFAEQHPVTGPDLRSDPLSILVERAGANGDDFALLGLLLCGVGDDNAARSLFFGGNAAHDHAVVQGTEMHAFLLLQNDVAYRPGQAGQLIDLEAAMAVSRGGPKKLRGRGPLG